MNTKNNARRKSSQNKIEAVFMELIKEKELNKISVSEICKRASVNRSTFYANYIDMYDLADSVRKKLEGYYHAQYDLQKGESENNYLLLFRHIQENMDFYKLYFKLGYDKDYKIFQYDKTLAEKHFGKNNPLIDYHCEFFKGGITTIIKMWLDRNCKETPEQLLKIITEEYRGRM